MKCIFSAQFKQLIKEMFIIAIVTCSLTLIIMFSIAGLGYVSIHWFDFINFVDVQTSGPIHYYFIQGLDILLLLVVAIVSLVSINYIFDCKDRL